MIRSMTGYGKQSLNVDGREYQIEIKSVNHRYLDISVKLPRTLSYLEENIKKQISEKVQNHLYCDTIYERLLRPG